MKITKRQLRRIIREETDRMLECGEDMAMDTAIPLEPAPAEDPLALGPVMETSAPAQELMVEMEVAARALEQVVESIQSAAHVCQDCGPVAAAQAPMVEAMATQAEALQEMLQAQAAVLEEGVTPEEAPVLDAVVDVMEEL